MSGRTGRRSGWVVWDIFVWAIVVMWSLTLIKQLVTGGDVFDAVGHLAVFAVAAFTVRWVRGLP